MGGFSKEESIVGRDLWWGLGFSRTVKFFFQGSPWGSLVCLCFGEVPDTFLLFVCLVTSGTVISCPGLLWTEGFPRLLGVQSQNWEDGRE